jgi:hypothetical protein
MDTKALQFGWVGVLRQPLAYKKHASQADFAARPPSLKHPHQGLVNPQRLIGVLPVECRQGSACDVMQVLILLLLLLMMMMMMMSIVGPQAEQRSWCTDTSLHALGEAQT